MGEIISSAAKKYVKNVESTQNEQHGQYTLSRGKALLKLRYILKHCFLSYVNNLQRIILSIFLTSELFQPGKFKSDEIWKPNQQQDNYPDKTMTKTQTPRRTFKSLGDVIQNNQFGGPVKQPSYHVPPGKCSFNILNKAPFDIIKLDLSKYYD